MIKHLIMAITVGMMSIALTGCTHNLYLMGRTNGVTGTAKVPPGRTGGEITISLGGKDFHGTWVYIQTGGSVGLSNATAFSGGQMATATGTFVGLPTGGNGNVMAAASDGTRLRCVFDYSEWNAKGIGQCQDSTGEMYDLQIN